MRSIAIICDITLQTPAMYPDKQYSITTNCKKKTIERKKYVNKKQYKESTKKDIRYIIIGSCMNLQRSSGISYTCISRLETRVKKVHLFGGYHSMTYA